MNKWEEYKISDLGVVITGRTPSSGNPEAFGKDYPFITPTDMDDRRIIDRTDRYISTEGAKLLSSILLPPQSICVSCIGWQLGKVILTKRASYTNQQINSIIPNGKFDTLFLYYLLTTKRVLLMNLGAKGVRTPIVNKSLFSSIKIMLPPLPTQRRVASILSAYDDLIENNTRRIAILEEIARRLYEEWFVNFRFPGHETARFVETELGLVPEGWEVAPLISFGTIITGKTPSTKQSENYGSDIPFLKLPDMHGQIYAVKITEHISLKGADAQKNKYIPKNSLCVSCIGTAGIVTITAEKCQTNQQINSLIPDNKDLLEFLYFSICSLKDKIQLHGANGATMTNLNKSKFSALKIISPPSFAITEYHLIAAPIFENILILQRKNVNLRAQRDLLLPKLISGELDVSEVEELVEEAAV